MERIKLVAFNFSKIITQHWTLLDLHSMCNSSEQIEIFNVVALLLYIPVEISILRTDIVRLIIS